MTDFHEYLDELHKEPVVDIQQKLVEINKSSQDLSRLIFQSPLETQIRILAKKQDLMLEILTLTHSTGVDQ